MCGVAMFQFHAINKITFPLEAKGTSTYDNLLKDLSKEWHMPAFNQNFKASIFPHISLNFAKF
jgi:hypothetical protein